MKTHIFVSFAVFSILLASCGNLNGNVTSSSGVAFDSSSSETNSSSFSNSGSSSSSVSNSGSSLTKYMISFVNFDGSILDEQEWAEGTLPSYQGGTPVREPTAAKAYTFIGWSPAIVVVSKAAIYVAQYSEGVRQYTVQFLNEDSTVLQTGLWDYEATPSYTGVTPTKASDALYNYIFTGFAPAITPVTSDQTYTARYSQVLANGFTITFKNNATELQTLIVVEGETPVYTGATPTRPSDGLGSYAFKGWSPAIVPATADATYYAIYDGPTYATLTYLSPTQGYAITASAQTGTIATLSIPSTYDDYLHGDLPVTDVGSRAFNDLDSLTSITLGLNITTVETYAFIGCDGLTTFDITPNVTSFAKDAFHGCENFSLLTVDSRNSVYSTSDHLSLLNKEGNVLLCLLSDTTTSYTTPAGVDEISTDAFAEAASINAVTCGAKKVDDNGLSNFNTLETVTFTTALESLGNYVCGEHYSSITTVNYQGTKAQWALVNKSSNWNYDANFSQVNCSDGVITL
jgi:hypothetical protein